MRKSYASPMAFLLVVLLLVMQFAGSSPALHGFLHGHVMDTHSCPDHPAPAGEDPGDSETGHGSCAVNLLSGGVTLAVDVVPERVVPACIAVSREESPARPAFRPRHAKSARAPPVL